MKRRISFLEKNKKEKEKLKRQRQKRTKKFLGLAAGVLVIGGIVFVGGWFSLKNSPVIPQSEIISQKGIHWHTDLTIKILGEYQEIPANIGLGITERPIHTHETDGVIHMEFSGLVKEDNLRLSRFFEIWGKKFSKDCIFDKCLASDSQLKMLVNGELNSEFENYIMQDRDKIEIIFG